jgi:hypothetical protein
MRSSPPSGAARRTSRASIFLRDFPIGDHDDWPDTLGLAFRLLGKLRGGKAAGVGLLP